MKKIAKISTLLGSMLILLTGCSMSGEGGSYAPGESGGRGGYGYDPDFYYSGDDSGRSSTGESDDSEHNKDTRGNKQIVAGQLTAKVLFDNEDENYGYFLSLLEENQNNPGIFYNYQQNFKLNYKRIKVVAKDAPYARVTLFDEMQNELWSSVADINGECYLYSDGTGKTVQVQYGEATKTYDVDRELQINDFANEAGKFEKIQVLFCIDATGSMSDEINYLKAEVADVITKIEDGTNANAEIGFVVYRDYSDEFLSRTFDFTENIDDALDFLSKQYARGGGDFEEAVEVAYEKILGMEWEEEATKVIVHVADAPSHDKDVGKWFDSVKDLSKIGARILTVASSGIDKKTEYLFRMQSFQSNGCYAYLTDDSKIGNPHLEADTLEKIPTEYLNALLIRVIKGFHNGTFDVPAAFDITGYPELLELNIDCGLGRAVQAAIAKKYIAQFGEGKENAKAAIENFTSVRNIPFVFMKDNFTEIVEEPTSETIEGNTFYYPDSTRKVMMFNGETFYTLSEALTQELITKEDIATVCNNFKKAGVFTNI